eukprot:391360_1
MSIQLVSVQFFYFKVFEEDIDMIIPENLTNVFGVTLENGRINAKSSTFCNSCCLNNLWERDEYMAGCACCKGMGHIFKCWKWDDTNISDMKKYMKQLKNKDVFCPDCTTNCRSKKNEDGKSKNCNKYKDDDIFSIKKE